MVERSVGLREHLVSGKYTLNDGVFFVPGALRGAIYDTNSGRVYSINKSGCDILTGSSKNAGFWEKLEPLVW